ncbi:MAG: preprotein translocase subunit SecG [Nitrospinota bacterium]
MTPDVLRFGLIAFHVVVGLFLILVVLLQTGRGASLGAAFGGASETMFGARGPGSFLSKLTTGAAIVFILTSLALAHPYFSKKGAGTVVRETTSPAGPAAPPGGAEEAPSGKARTPGSPTKTPAGGG